MNIIKLNLFDNFIFLKDDNFFYYREFIDYFNIDNSLYTKLVLEFESYYRSILKNTIELWTK
jgi:hypothetical protein